MIHHSFPVEKPVLSAYPRLSKHLAELKENDRMIAEDLSMLFKNETDHIWKDSCHANAKGSRMVLDRITDLLKQNLPLAASK